MIRRLVTLLGIFSLTYFTACGGGDDSAPPPIPPQAKNQEQDFKDLMAQANKMKATCTQDLTPMFLILATQSQSSGGGQNQAMAMMPQMMQQQQQGQDPCKNDLLNFLMALNTIMIPGVGPYANTPEGKEYAKTQIIGVMNRIYGRIMADYQARGITLTPQQQLALQQDLLQFAQVFAVSNVGSLGQYATPVRTAGGF